MASLVESLRKQLEELGEVVKKADISSGWFAVYPNAWQRRSDAAELHGREGPNLIVYRTRSTDPRDHFVVPFAVVRELLTDDTLTHSEVHGSVRWNLTLLDGQLHVSHRPGKIDVSRYHRAPLLLEGIPDNAWHQPSAIDCAAGAAQGVLEGIERETKVISKSRSAKLRRVAVKRSKGICEACNTDFSVLFGGMGLRTLQVHHKQQLALRTVPTVTSPDDLAVVCANCHLMIHADPKASLEVTVLRDLWATVRTPPNPAMEPTARVSS